MNQKLAVLHPGLETEVNIRPVGPGFSAGPKLQARQRLAPRLPSLKGTRLALLDNSKVNARELLNALAKRLQAQFGVAEVRPWRKPSPAKGAEFIPELLAWKPDLVLTASGD